MALNCFVTGTDTDVGKTLLSAALLHKSALLGFHSVGMKPVAAGCQQTVNGLRNDDALLLQKFSSLKLPYESVNPFALEAAIAPHIAAKQEGKTLSLAALQTPIQSLLDNKADFTLIEGAGGWLVPLNEKETLADLAKAFQLPVIMVVSIKLGCINHALLTARAIQADGLSLIAWVASLQHGDSGIAQENIAAIQQAIKAPLLATLPKLPQQNSDEKILAASQYIRENVFMKLITNTENAA